MTKEEAIQVLAGLLSKYCSDCPMIYEENCDCEARESIDMAINSLSAEPSKSVKYKSNLLDTTYNLETIAEIVRQLGHLDGCIANILDRQTGEWTEKEVMVDEDINIMEWQSARCSVCGKYHTTPYMYYFDNFNFCPNCGADMRGDK